MKVLYGWLRERCPVEQPPEELAELLTSRGAKVESIDRPWAGLSGVVVARVLEVTDHPDSETLCVARIAVSGAERTVVAGVRNFKAGDLIPYAPPGARVPLLSDPLAERRLRGVVSEGMLCSARELAVSADHGGILVLPGDAPEGADVAALFGLDDVLFDIEVTPNRPDLLSVTGLAREAAAATGAPFLPPEPEVVEEGEVSGAVTVRIEDRERCPRYLARVITGVEIGPSPISVQARLTAMGMRPLSNVVDATNYVLLDVGQPLHPFDLRALAGPGIVVRRAADGERFVTLDGVERFMTAEDLMIADLERSVAVAGIMGGATSEVSSTTNDVLLESASFAAVGVLRTARRLELRTEASIRFERGADPEAVPVGAARAAELMRRWAGGTVLRGVVEAGATPTRRHVTVRPTRAGAVLGYPVSAADAEEAFGRLGVRAARPTEDLVEVEVPGYRPDLQIEVDLIEEIVRVQGYDRVGTTVPHIRQAGGVPATHDRRRRVRAALAAAGLRETWSASFASREDLDLTAAEGVRVANPLTADQAFLRASLVPGVLSALRGNLARQVPGAFLFEVGTVFAPVGDGVEESELATFAMAGPASAYPAERRDVDVFDARGAVEVLLEAFDVEWQPGPLPGRLGTLLHPGRSASIVAGGEEIGWFGELHPRTAGRLDLPGRVALGEVDLAGLARHQADRPAVTELPRFPPVRRDLAFVLDRDVPAASIRETIAEEELVASVTLFDVFEGPPVPEGRRSLAFGIELRAPDRTLTDADADRAVQAIAQRLSSRFGAELRTA